MDFNASTAVELVYAVETAAAHVELNDRRKEQSMKSLASEMKRGKKEIEIS